MNEPKKLNYPLSEAKAEIVNGERKHEAIINQEPKENLTNTITVDEVKKEVKKGVESVPETDLSNYYTKSQVNALVGTKLYKHLIGNDNPADLFYIQVITTRETPFEQSTKLGDALDSLYDDGKLISVYGYGELSMMIYDYDHTLLIYFDDIGLQNIDISAKEIYSDTVTEL